MSSAHAFSAPALSDLRYFEKCQRQTVELTPTGVPAALMIPRLSAQAQWSVLDMADKAEKRTFSRSRLARHCLLLDSLGIEPDITLDDMDSPSALRCGVEHGWLAFSKRLSPMTDLSAMWRLSKRAYDSKILAGWLAELVQMEYPAAESVAHQFLTNPAAPHRVMTLVCQYLNQTVAKLSAMSAWKEQSPDFSFEKDALYWHQPFQGFDLNDLGQQPAHVQGWVRKALWHLSCELRPLGLPPMYVDFMDWILGEIEEETGDIESAMYDMDLDSESPAHLEQYFTSGELPNYYHNDSAEAYQYNKGMLAARSRIDDIWRVEVLDENIKPLSVVDETGNALIEWAKRTLEVKAQASSDFCWSENIVFNTPILMPEMSHFEDHIQQLYEDQMNNEDEDVASLEGASLAEITAAINDSYTTVRLMCELIEILNPTRMN